METQTGVKKRLVIEIDPHEHKAIKARALLQGLSMKEYVLRKLRRDDDFDMEDVTDSITEALKEVKRYKDPAVKEKPETARSFFNTL